MFENRNYNNESQKRLAKFTLIKYRINFQNYGIFTWKFRKVKFFRYIPQPCTTAVAVVCDSQSGYAVWDTICSQDT